MNLNNDRYDFLHENELRSILKDVIRCGEREWVEWHKPHLMDELCDSNYSLRSATKVLCSMLLDSGTRPDARVRLHSLLLDIVSIGPRAEPVVKEIFRACHSHDSRYLLHVAQSFDSIYSHKLLPNDWFRNSLYDSDLRIQENALAHLNYYLNNISDWSESLAAINLLFHYVSYNVFLNIKPKTVDTIGVLQLSGKFWEGLFAVDQQLAIDLLMDIAKKSLLDAFHLNSQSANTANVSEAQRALSLLLGLTQDKKDIFKKTLTLSDEYEAGILVKLLKSINEDFVSWVIAQIDEIEDWQRTVWFTKPAARILPLLGRDSISKIVSWMEENQQGLETEGLSYSIYYKNLYAGLKIIEGYGLLYSVRHHCNEKAFLRHHLIEGDFGRLFKRISLYGDDGVDSLLAEFSGNMSRYLDDSYGKKD